MFRHHPFGRAGRSVVFRLFISAAIFFLVSSHAQTINLNSQVIPTDLSLFSNIFFAHRRDDPPAMSNGKGRPLGIFSEPPQLEGLNSLNIIPGTQKDGDSVIVFDGFEIPKIVRANQEPEASLLAAKNVVAVIFPTVQFPRFYRTISNFSNAVCCSNLLVRNRKCSPGDVIILRDTPDLTMVPLSNITKPSAYHVAGTGSYLVFLNNCLDETVSVKGSIFLRNYYGYLSGRDAPKVTVYFFTLFVYGTMVLGWLGFLAYRRKFLIHIHWAICLVATAAMAESLLWYFYLRERNESPNRPMTLAVAASVVSVLKAILSYMLVLVASLGWGITKPSLDSSTQKKIALTTTSYFFLDCARKIFINTDLFGQISVWITMAYIIPLAILQAVICFWILSALGQTIQELQMSGEREKLAVFTKFWSVFICTSFALIFFIMIQIIVASWDVTLRWREDWLFLDLTPQIAFFIILLTMMILWRPTRRSQFIAYSFQLPTIDGQPAETPGTAGQMREVPHSFGQNEGAFDRIQQAGLGIDTQIVDLGQDFVVKPNPGQPTTHS